MKYIANPVEVDAFKIVKVIRGAAFRVTLENGEERSIDEGLVARFVPRPGDYYVIQSDGYVYLNPKSVFERKYSPFFQGPLVGCCPVVGCKIIGPHDHKIEGPVQS